LEKRKKKKKKTDYRHLSRFSWVILWKAKVTYGQRTIQRDGDHTEVHFGLFCLNTTSVPNNKLKIKSWAWPSSWLFLLCPGDGRSVPRT
jgi:hypothetical protein